MRNLRKRFLALALSLIMVLSLLPGTAYAALGDLLQNTPAHNASLLEQLEAFTGESYEEAYELLSALGLLDEDGNLITDRSICLDGVEYTLEEIEELLRDPDTDLTQVAEVDGVPIALGDLATIIAIEQELQYLQEKYFSGRTFEGEALENLNSLLAQLQTQGMTLNATTHGNEVVLSQTGEASLAGYGIHYISASGLQLEEGDTFKVKFKLAIPDSMKKFGDSNIVVGFRNSLTSGSQWLASETIAASQADPNQEYELTYTVKQGDYTTSSLYLAVWYEMSSFGTIDFNALSNFYDYSFGTFYGGVSFYEPEGFLFGDGSGKKAENWNCFFDYELNHPELVGEWKMTGPVAPPDGIISGISTVAYFFLTRTSESDGYDDLGYILGYLNKCIGDSGTVGDDETLRFRIDTTIAHSNTEGTALNCTFDQFVAYSELPVGGEIRFTVDQNGEQKGFPLTLASGTSTEISFIAFDDTLPDFFYVPYMADGSSGNTYEQVNIIESTTSNTTVTLVDPKTGNESKPALTITAPAGTYKSGDLVPITITGDEYIKASADATVTINNTPYQLSDLHSSTDGKFISFLYEVKEIDSATLTVQSVTGITDFFGNPAKEVSGESISGVELATPQMKNAVESLAVTYTDGALHFTITAKQDEAYQTFYANHKEALMQLLITVDDSAPVAHAVTVGEDTVHNGFTFTAAPYTIAPTSQEQTVTVQLQVNTGTAAAPSWVTVNRVTQTATVGALLDVTGVTASVVDDAGETIQPGEDGKYTVAMDEIEGKTYKLQEAFTPADATYQTGTWHSSNAAIATVSNGGEGNPEAGTIQFQSQTGEVEFWFVADNGTEDTEDDKESPHLTFVVTAGNSLILNIPPYAQDSLIQAGKDATVSWVTNVFDFYPNADVTFKVSLFAGTDATGTPTKTYTVENPAASTEKITECTIPAADLLVTYPQSQYTVQVSMASPEARSDDTGITVLSPPTEMRITADKTSITDGEPLELNYSINNASATGTLSATRMVGGETPDDTGNWLTATSVSGEGTVTFTPSPVSEGALYDTYTITFTEDTQQAADANFAPSTDSLVLYVYKSNALSILVEGTEQESISLSNRSVVDGTLPTDSEAIMELRQTLGLIRYVSINADDYNWSSFRDGIRWILQEGAENVAINYKQGGLWDNIEDLPYETYLPQSQMAVSATGDVTQVTVTATHAATGMTDTVTVSAETLQDQFYLFQVTPAETTTVTYTSGSGETRTLTTNTDGLLAVYEADGIASDVQFRSGTESDPYLGTISQEALSSGERDAAKLQLYPLNTITLVPAARAELYLVKPDGTPYANQTVTLRGGVYLGGYYCEDVNMRATSTGTPVPGNQDNTYTTNADGMLTVYMDATQFNADGYTGQLTNAALDYWFELRNLGSNNEYYPVLVNIQGSMSADRILRTGSAVVMLESVPDGEEEKPYLTAQTLSYGEADGSGDLKVRSVLGSTGTVGPNSTYQYAELTSYFMLWGVNNDDGQATVTMTGENGFAPAGQTVEDSTFPFASIPVITNTMVLTKETMTDSGWLQPETAETLRASVYQNGTLVKQVTMPFRVIDLTDVQLVNVDASALILEMQGSFVDSINNGDSIFTFGNNRIGNIFSLDIQEMLEEAGVSSSPLFKVLITPSEDNSVFNVLIWGGYNSLDLNDFDYDNTGLSMDYELLNTEVDFGVPAVNDLSDMAKGTFDPSDAIDTGVSNRTNSSLDFGAQLEGYYEGQFYYDVDNQEWAFRATGGGFTAGASVSFQGNVNAWVGPIPITGTFGAGIALQLDFKTATMYTDQQSEAVLATWTDEAQNSASVSDYLTTLRLNGYVNAFGGLGFDYCVLALKIGLFGQLTGDSTNRFLSRTYLADSTQQQINGQGVGVSGEVGIKFVAKFLFISYEAVIGSGSISYSATFNDWDTIDNYWNGSGGVTGLQMSAPTLLSRDYLAAYANGTTRWNSGTAQFSGTASVVQDDANPGSEPAVNDDGSLSVYISDMDSDNYFDSRIMAGSVGTEGTAIDDDGYGDMSPSLSGDSDFTVAAWIRLFENLEDQEEGEALTTAQQKQLLNSTEIMVATTSDKGTSWTVKQLTDNATPDLAPVTASNGSDAVVFWRSVYASEEDNLLNFDTQNAIYYSRYVGNTWSEGQMVYNGSIGNVVGIQASMLPDGAAIVAFTVDRDPDNDVSTDYEMAYRVVQSDGTLGDLVVLTSDEEIDTNPQVAAVSAGETNYFVLAWYSTQDGGDVRLQAVGSDGELYSGGSDYAVPASVKAVSQEENLVISSDFRFAKRTSGSTIDGLTLVWAETANNDDGAADHSVLYGTQLSRTTDGSLCLSTPQALITLPDRTLSNSFSAWQSGSTVNAYIFGTWYSPTAVEVIDEISVPVDADRLLTGGGTMTEKSVSVDSIAVDYATLQTNSFAPVVFTVRNTGTAALEDVTVAIDNYSADSVALSPGESASVTVMYKTGDTIDNPDYTVTSGSSTLVNDTLYLDYNDLGISNIKVVDESEGQRTVLVTLYNDSAAKLEGSGRTVELSFYTDSEHSDAANVTLSGNQTGVTASGNTVTISDDALRRIDQGSMTLLVTYDLESYVTGTLGQQEVPASGVYLYANAVVKKSGSTTAMAEYATGNNSGAVLMTGAYARTGEKTTLDVTMDNASGTTEATVTLKNNSLQEQPSGGTLLAVLLDGNGSPLETTTVADSTGLTCEETKSVDVQFSALGSDVILLYAPGGETGLQALQFSGMDVELSDFVLDSESGNYVYTLPADAPASTVVTFISDSEVTVNGTEYDGVGSAEVTIPTGNSSITVTTGGKTYTLYLYRSGGTGGSTGGGSGGGSTRYTITVEDSSNGEVTANRTTASAGSTITLTVTPEDGYQLADLTVTDRNGREITLNDRGNGTYTFTMPSGAVTVEAAFTPVATEPLPFTDVPDDSYYYDAVNWAVSNGITNGTSATTFSPDNICTRAQMVTFLWRAAGSPAPHSGSNPFVDVTADAYYYTAVLWAVEQGITNGTSATTFSPDDTVTRSQTVTFLWRYSGSPEASGSSFTDVEADAYYATAVAWAAREGITSGTSATTFSPYAPCTRAQIVTFLYRAQ